MKTNLKGHLGPINNAADLKNEIRLLELRCREKEELIKELFGEVAESVKPSTLLKNAIPASLSIIGSSGKQKILRGALGFAAGLILKRIFRKKKPALTDG